MEFEVKLVGGIENCYVSLPLALIQTLHSSAPSLPPVLALELRSSSNDDRWNVAWSGATSASPAIEVAQQFGECLSLPDRSRVQVRALLNVAKATLVTIEPSTEDDWEVMELNSELAEAAILNQVRIVHEAMKFPLWLHGRTTITFLVVSTFPKKACNWCQGLKLQLLQRDARISTQMEIHPWSRLKEDIIFQKHYSAFKMQTGD